MPPARGTVEGPSYCFSSEVDTSAGGGGGAGGQILEPGETPGGGTNPDAAVPVMDGGDIDPPPDAGDDGGKDGGGDGSVDAGGDPTPYCANGTLFCEMSEGKSLTCALSDGGRNACCATVGSGKAAMCTPACVAPDRYCCSSDDCGEAECCGLPLAPNQPRRCEVKLTNDSGLPDGGMIKVGCFDAP